MVDGQADDRIGGPVHDHDGDTPTGHQSIVLLSVSSILRRPASSSLRARLIVAHIPGHMDRSAPRIVRSWAHEQRYSAISSAYSAAFVARTLMAASRRWVGVADARSPPAASSTT